MELSIVKGEQPRTQTAVHTPAKELSRDVNTKMAIDDVTNENNNSDICSEKVLWSPCKTDDVVDDVTKNFLKSSRDNISNNSFEYSSMLTWSSRVTTV